MERYARQTILPEIGPEGQEKLLKSSVLIVGLGGLGCPVGLYATGAGIGRIGLCDPDKVSLSNLHRQTLYSESMTGVPKTRAAYERLSALSSDTDFELWPDGLTESNAREIIGRYDLVIDCCDNYATRYLIDDVCNELSIPWVYGSIGEFRGCVGVFEPGLPRYSDLFPERDDLAPRPASSGGVVGALPGIIGAIEAAEALKLICGFGERLAGRILAVDLKSLSFNILDTSNL